MSLGIGCCLGTIQVVNAVPAAGAIEAMCRRPTPRAVCGPALRRQELATSESRRLLRALAAMRTDLPGLVLDSDLERFAWLLAVKGAYLADLAALVREGALFGSPVDPHDPDWEPLGAIVELHAQGDVEEATWLAFLATHVGGREDDQQDFWRAVRAVYAGLGDARLTWTRVIANPEELVRSQEQHDRQLAGLRFANHRKYESWKQLARVLQSYVAGIRGRGGSQRSLFERPSLSPTQNFDRLMEELSFIYRFSRLGIYDLLCLLGDLRVYALTPGRLYLRGATGPLNGAYRLFGEDADAYRLDERGCDLAARLGVPIDAMEDALCNWQKDA